MTKAERGEITRLSESLALWEHQLDKLIKTRNSRSFSMAYIQVV